MKLIVPTKLKMLKNLNLNLSFKILVLFIFFYSFSSGQCDVEFDKNKWITDEVDSSLNTNSYRAYIVDECSFLDMIIGQNKSQIKKLLGKPDFHDGRKSFRKGRTGFVYCFEKNTKNKNSGCQHAFVTIFFDKGIVTEYLRFLSGG